MKLCLGDVNVWLALLVAHHEHHARASFWYGGLRAGQAAMPRLVQLGVVRLLCNRTVMGDYALAASQAWRTVEELLEDERVELLPEPERLEETLAGFLTYPVPTPKLLNDAYLAAVAVASGRQLVTLDRGFTHFRELDLKLL